MSYWMTRLRPLLGRKVVAVVCNRIGVEKGVFSFSFFEVLFPLIVAWPKNRRRVWRMQLRVGSAVDHGQGQLARDTTWLARGGGGRGRG